MTRQIRTSSMYPNPPTGGVLADIRAYLKSMDMPDYRFNQIVQSLQHGTEYFEDVQELPKSLRQKLKVQFGETPLPLKPAVIHSANQVEKVLFETKSGAKIETVLSHYREGWTSMCISSQSGCGLGCTFCATAAMGLMKNLTADEICAQVFHSHWNKQLPDSIAFMGMGEALANPNIFEALKAFTTKGYGGISQRRMTVSTVGFAPNLERLVNQFPQVTITLSVHSPFSVQRAELIPLEKRFSLQENLAILDTYVKKFNRKVYLAYLLIAGLNDTNDHLKRLVDLIKLRERPKLFHVSVIRYNPAFGANPSFQQPTKEKVSEFVEQLNAHGIDATRRTQFGSGIEAACGQLHADYIKKNKGNI
ncbi:radical SAM protein [Mariniflexile gromovii]|uniref:Radical SAM protein n=1 Tax=Mariniflexile gromovii TaxID=362523 RepID=A0ABS4BQ70_9FLAO|nr:radical SAM protein [Mariniflexile gromovii]MBP0902215.1 radical SAM protein [Mariniflexile gromovii]